MWGYGHMRIQAVDRAVAQAPHKKIAVLQGNIGQDEKWDLALQWKIVETYTDLAVRAARNSPDLVVWPETAIPFLIGHNHPVPERLQTGIRRTGTDHLVGSLTASHDKGRAAYHNSAILFDDRGRIVEHYKKVQLVPHGEYAPYKKWLPFTGKLVAHGSDFVRGKKGQTIAWQGERLGALICYEISFPGLSRAMVNNGADILVNMSNDAWFGRTSGPYQHFSMAVFRSIENRRGLVRAANTGFSGFIGPAGRILEGAGFDTPATLARNVPLMGTTTVYTRAGDLFAAGCLVVSLVAGGCILVWRLLTKKSKGYEQ